MLEKQKQASRDKVQGIPAYLESCPLHLASGFVLPAAVFLLVVLGGLAAWMMQLTTATLAQEDLEIQGARAYQAAQAGLEAGISIAAALPAAADCTTVKQTITFVTGQLTDFTASVTCLAYTANEGGTIANFFQIASVACNQPTSGVCPNPTPTLGEYAERKMQATVESGS